MRDLFYFLIRAAWMGGALSLAGEAIAAGGPPMNTDDPGTVADGHWEINVATLSARAGGTANYQLPLIDANYGASDRLQLKFEMPWVRQSEPNGVSRTGLSDGLAGMKWRFYDGGENGWQMATYPQISFAVPRVTETNNGLTASGVSYFLPVEFEHDFENGDINFELGRWVHPAQQVDIWIAGFAYTHKTQNGLVLIAELYDQAAVHTGGDELILNFGTRWNFSERYSLLFSAGRDVHNSLGSSNTLLTYLGLQMRY